MARHLHIAAVPPSEMDKDAVLFVDRGSLRAVVDALEGSADVRSFALEAPPGDAGPPLVHLLIVQSDVGRLRVEVRNRELALTGDAGSFRELAAELTEFAAYNDLDEPGMHTHIDRSWTPPLAWIAEDSLPLMVAGWTPDAL